MRRLLFLISSSPSVFSIVYLNRVNRDFAIFRELGFSEFQAEFHAGLVELTVQITHQRIDQSAARALSHILPTPIDALCLTPMVFVPLSVRWITCGQSAFTMSHVFSASATGFQQIGSASRLVIRQNASAHLHALSCIYISITYFVTHAACSIAKECTAFYISAHPRLRLRPEMQWASFSISLLLRVAATASKPLSNAQIQGLFLLPSRIGMYKSTNTRLF